MEKLLNTKEAAPLIGITAGTLENWRVAGIGPKFIKTPGKRGKVLYRVEDIQTWRDANSYSSTKEY